MACCRYVRGARTTIRRLRLMAHYVLIQEPRREGIYVQCKDIDQCLHVVDDELKMNLTGTRITMFRKEPRQHAELLAMWYIEREGPRRYRVNDALRSVFGDLEHPVL